MILICNPPEPFPEEGKIQVFPSIYDPLPPITPAPPTPIYIQFIPESRVIINLLSHVTRGTSTRPCLFAQGQQLLLDQLGLPHVLLQSYGK